MRWNCCGRRTTPRWSRGAAAVAAAEEAEAVAEMARAVLRAVAEYLIAHRGKGSAARRRQSLLVSASGFRFWVFFVG